MVTGGVHGALLPSWWLCAGPGAAGPAGGGEDDDEEGGKGKGSKAARKREAAEAERKIREAELARSATCRPLSSATHARTQHVVS